MWLQSGAQPQLLLLQPHPWAQQHLLLTVLCTNTHPGDAVQQQAHFRAATNARCENSLSPGLGENGPVSHFIWGLVVPCLSHIKNIVGLSCLLYMQTGKIHLEVPW